MKHFDDIRFQFKRVYDSNTIQNVFLAGGTGSGKTFVTKNAFGGTGLG